MKFQSIFIICILAAVTRTGLAIECYECNSETDAEHCGEHLQSQFVQPVDCAQVQTRAASGAETNAGAGGNLDYLQGSPTPKHGGQNLTPVCFKAVFEGIGGAHDMTARGCGLEGKTDQCKYIGDIAKQKGLKVKKCKVCEENLCNNANRGLSVSLALLIAVPIIMLYSHHN